MAVSPEEVVKTLAVEEDLTLARLVFALGATIYPLWWPVYKYWLEAAFDPLWQRLLVGATCLIALGLTWSGSAAIRRNVSHLFALVGWIVTGHIFYLLAKNQMHVSYVIGTFLVVFAVSAALTSPVHMVLFSLFACVAAALSARGAELPAPIFVVGVLTVCSIATGLMSVRMRLSRRSQQRYVAKLALESELTFGRQVQALIMPSALSGACGRYSYRVTLKPALHMSGDWCQSYVSPPGSERFVALLAIGDVVSKGASAALVTTAIASVWRVTTSLWQDGQVDPVGLIQAINATLHGVFKGDQNTTLSLAVLTDEDVALYTFGAPAWIARRAEGQVDKHVPRGADPLGFQAHIAVPEPIRLKAETDQLLVGYTDGVIDSSKGRREFVERLPQAGKLAVGDLLARIEDMGIELARAHGLDDDFTMITVVTGPAPAKSLPAA